MRIVFFTYWGTIGDRVLDWLLDENEEVQAVVRIFVFLVALATPVELQRPACAVADLCSRSSASQEFALGFLLVPHPSHDLSF